ncbi:hypothetical protein [Corallococcus aberystwythensis]|nr:hypothetical protein [Corallococcus aberystwythensis]
MSSSQRQSSSKSYLRMTTRLRPDSTITLNVREVAEQRMRHHRTR